MTLTEAKPIKNQGTKINIAVVNDTLSNKEMNKLLQCTREIERNKEGRVIDVFLDISDINITAKDTFSVEELKKLAQCIREIEQNKPERHINILMDTPEKTVKEMEGIFESIKPVLPHKMIIEFGKKGT